MGRIYRSEHLASRKTASTETLVHQLTRTPWPLRGIFSPPTLRYQAPTSYTITILHWLYVMIPSLTSARLILSCTAKRTVTSAAAYRYTQPTSVLNLAGIVLDE